MDECLPDLDFCGSNALCIDQGGQYMCICAIGYERDEQALLCIGRLLELNFNFDEIFISL